MQLVHSDTTASIHSSSPVSSATSPPLRTPQARKITGTASNPAGGAAISNARFDFTFTGDPGLQASQITLQYPTGATTFGTVPLSGATTAGGAITGYFGPLGGFSFPAGATNTTSFRITVAADASSGTLTSVATLDTVSSSGTVMSTMAASTPGSTTITAPVSVNTYSVSGTATRSGAPRRRSVRNPCGRRWAAPGSPTAS